MRFLAPKLVSILRNCVSPNQSRISTFVYPISIKLNMKKDEDLQKDVTDAIHWEPQLIDTHIHTEVLDGKVTLTGDVDNYFKKSVAETTVKNVAGVKEVHECLTVSYTTTSSDAEIELAVLQALKWNWDIGNKRIEVSVKNGWVTLQGELHWAYERTEVGRKTLSIKDVKGISNNIKIVSQIEIEAEEILKALHRNWALKDQEISVLVSGHHVTLKGNVDSIFKKDEAVRIALKGPGVWEVRNELSVKYKN
jgi:osmotically-inducible protein OsmY